ncbi:MAG: aminotransferase class III-fold pyridoxal phosphate-dependent enzyme, partial [Planctomycetota bacterium]
AAEKKGAAVVEALTAAGIGRIREVRGKGLMIGIELDGPGKDVLAGCLDRGLIINCTQDTVLRLAPALTISESDLSSGLEILIDVLKA